MPAIHQRRPPARILDPEGPLLLVAPAVRHAGPLVQAIQASLPALRAFMPFAHIEQTEAVQYDRMVQVSADYWRGHDYTLNLVDPAAPEQVLGCVGLHRRAHHKGALEVGYWVRSDRTGQGLCTRAARMVVALAVAHFDCVRVQCTYDPANLGSARVAQKVGFKVEADLPGFLPVATDAMRADGWLGGGTARMTSLSAAQARSQPWWEPTLARLQWWDWRGRAVPSAHLPSRDA